MNRAKDSPSDNPAAAALKSAGAEHQQRVDTQGGRSNEQTLAERVWFRLIRLDSRLHAVMSERFKEAGLSVPQCDILTTLSEKEGISQQELAKRLYVTKGNISGLVDRLASAGLVERQQLAHDRRAYAIYLTDAGREAALKGIGLQRAFVAETFGNLPPHQLEELDRLLVAVRDVTRRAMEAASKS